jgi:zinc transporter ZupT
MKTTMIAITSSYIVCPLLAIPVYIAFSIHPFNKLFDVNGKMVDEKSLNATSMVDMQLRNITVYRIQPSQVAERSHLLQINFWIYSVVIKLVPCVALTILSLRLIYALLDAKQRRKQLMSNSNGMKTIVNGKVVENKGRKNSKVLDKERQTDRTTRMLLAVLLLFLITEFPQGILGLLSAVLHPTFLYNCYLKLGKNLLGVCVLGSSSVERAYTDLFIDENGMLYFEDG